MADPEGASNPINPRLETVSGYFKPFDFRATEIPDEKLVELSIAVANSIAERDLETLRYIAETSRTYQPFGRDGVSDYFRRGQKGGIILGIGHVAKWAYFFETQEGGSQGILSRLKSELAKPAPYRGRRTPTS